MELTNRMECLSCGWRGEARELRNLTIRLQASPQDLEEKACPECMSIAVEKINPRRRGTHRYTGITNDLEARLRSHNQENNPHTSKYRPWQIETAITFRSRDKAAAFEKYLKSHSGRAFASKHF